MSIKNHIIFNIIFIFIIKNINIVKFTFIEWNLIFIISIISCLIPDIDHPNSFIGRKIKFISIPLNKIFGHREITHSILFILLIYKYIKFLFKKIYNNYILFGIILGLINHIVADMTTKKGVSLLWPIKYKFKINIKILYLILIIMLILNIIFLCKTYTKSI